MMLKAKGTRTLFARLQGGLPGLNLRFQAGQLAG
jgi:hypothetical protein